MVTISPSQLAKELLMPLAADERRKHKLKRLVQHPNSYFMDVKVAWKFPSPPPPQCPGCYRITTVFSHAQTVVVCSGCSTVLCQSTGGRARLTEGRSPSYHSAAKYCYLALKVY
jgi:small subunit ribosomal protein S27e